jgi:hypothetical protein
VAHLDAARKPARISCYALLLELRKTGLPALLYSAEEVLVRPVKIAESFLRCALGDFAHPREVGILQGVQLPVLFDGSTRLPSCLVLFDATGEPPVACESRSAYVLTHSVELT